MLVPVFLDVSTSEQATCIVHGMFGLRYILTLPFGRTRTLERPIDDVLPGHLTGNVCVCEVWGKLVSSEESCLQRPPVQDVPRAERIVGRFHEGGHVA